MTNIQCNENQPNATSKTSSFDLKGAYIAGGVVNAQTVTARQIGGNISITPEQKQNLAEAAAEIQQLLKQLEQTYPMTTTSEQLIVAAEAIKHIESNPNLKKRAIRAITEGGLAAFEKAIDNPAGAFIVGAIKGWQEAE
jgi:cell division protein ZapA (FtsZ GTPase activity inhibitor)